MPRVGCLGGYVEDQILSALETCKAMPERVSLYDQLLSTFLQNRPDKSGPGRPRSPKVNGPKVRALRKQAGLTQRELAIAVNQYFRGDNGKREDATLRAIKRYENCSPAGKQILYLDAIATELSKRLQCVTALSAAELLIPSRSTAREN